MTDLYALFGAKPHVLKLKSSVQEEPMKMDAKNTTHASKDQLATITNFAQDIAQLNVIFSMSISALNHQKMDALNHQLVKQRKPPIKENTAMNNIAN